jgi:hypothetical protein
MKYQPFSLSWLCRPLSKPWEGREFFRLRDAEENMVEMFTNAVEKYSLIL